MKASYNYNVIDLKKKTLSQKRRKRRKQKKKKTKKNQKNQ